MAVPSHLSIDQGTTFEQQFLWRDPSGVPINLTGYDVRMQIRDSQDYLVLDVETPGSITLGGEAGTIMVTIPADTTALMPIATVLYYELIVIYPNGTIKRLIKDLVHVSKGIVGDAGGDPYEHGLYTIDGGTP